ncbi:YncE family protein [Bacillus salipaludis]|uniref:YncE family protein n=1 Tax=Bacillus salipaludis TaxID=2547811 RepID=A0ABW8R9P4_9BACI
MKGIIRFLLSFFIFFLSLGPFIYGKSVHAESASKLINLSFTPYDTALDPVKPIIYMTELGSPKLYAINYSTGEIKQLTLPYPAERLDYYNNKIYVTQQKMNHTHYTTAPRFGAIAEVDTENFNVSNTLDIDEDPYDIAVDKDGFIYISPGSDQHGNLRVYSMKDKTEITQDKAKTSMYEWADIRYNPKTSKIYAINTNLSPTDIKAYEIEKGVVQKSYGSPYQREYHISTFTKFSPDGLKIYNASGNVFSLAPN